MANRGIFSPTRSIRIRLLAISLGLAALAVIFISGVAVDSIRNVGARTQTIASQALRAQAQDYLAQVNARNAMESNQALQQISNDLYKIGLMVTQIYSDADRLVSDNYFPLDQHMYVGENQQYLNSKKDLSSVFVPNYQPVDDIVQQDIRLTAYMDMMLAATLKNNPSGEAIYYGTVHNVIRYYPNIGLGEIVPGDFNIPKRPWFMGAAGPENTTKGLYWTPPYLDATGKGIVTTAALPVYDGQGNLMGVVGLDVSLSDMKSNIEAGNILKTGFSFLIDHNGRGLAMPERAYKPLLGRPSLKNETSPDLKTARQGFSGVIAAMMAGRSGSETVTADQQEYFVSYSPLGKTGWSLGSVVDSATVLQNLANLQTEVNQTTQSMMVTRVLPLSVAVFAILLALGLVVVSRIVAPIQKLAGAAEQIGAGKWDVDLPPAGRDEVGLLTRSFASMAQQVKSLVGNLEQHVAERTHDLERRSLQLQTAAEVARDVTVGRDLDELLKRAVNLVHARFNLYFVSIFLVDELGEYAFLEAATGEAGEFHLERHLRLKIGEQGLIGSTISNGQTRIVNDVAADSEYLADPLLPDTQAEMVLPLRIGDTIIGALDLQKAAPPNASAAQQAAAIFTSEDAAAFQVLADQLAVAIDKTRIVQRLEATVKEVDVLYQRQVQQNWLGRTRVTRNIYEYNRVQVNPLATPRVDLSLLSDELNAQLHAGKVATLSPDKLPGASGETMLVPVVLRDQLIGVIGLEHDTPGQSWPEDALNIVQATATQAALTLENARLIEETRRRAEREAMIGFVAARVRETLDMDTVLKTAIREIGRAMNVDEVEVRMGAGQTPGVLTAEPGNGKAHDLAEEVRQ